MAETSWYVYIVKCSDSSLYTGITSDVERRINEHNKGIGGKYTRIRRPVELAYTEICADRSTALKRERLLKTMPRKRKMALILGDKREET